MDGAPRALIQGSGPWFWIKVFVTSVEKLVKQTYSIVASNEVAT